MTQFYNKPKLKERRQDLRNNMTVPEVILWSKIQRKQLGFKFRRQFSIGNFVLDFYCVPLKLAIELDGESHYVGKAPKKDAARDAFLKSIGVTSIRVTNHDIRKNLNGVLELIYYSASQLAKPRTPLDPPL
jgi:very-short-patch-repair endonuclease